MIGPVRSGTRLVFVVLRARLILSRVVHRLDDLTFDDVAVNTARDMDSVRSDVDDSGGAEDQSDGFMI